MNSLRNSLSVLEGGRDSPKKVLASERSPLNKKSELSTAINKGVTRLMTGQVKLSMSSLGIILGRSCVTEPVPILVREVVLALK